MQPVDVTTLGAVLAELRRDWLPARVEGIRQESPHTLRLLLRTAFAQEGVVASCHPVAARLHLSQAKVRGKNTSRYPFAQQLFNYLGGQVLVQIEQPAWERVAILHFAQRPADPVMFKFYVEIMGKYSNLMLTDHLGKILCIAHPVSSQQSRVRPLTPGDFYTPPPPLLSPIPDRQESFSSWWERVSLLPLALEKALIQSYRGVSRTLATQLLGTLAPKLSVTQVTPLQAQILYQSWLSWLTCLESNQYQGGFTREGYTVLGWEVTTKISSINELLDRYYGDQLSQQARQQQQQRLGQVVGHALGKVQSKLTDFKDRYEKAENYEDLKQKADLLMAFGQKAPAGQQLLTLPDFEHNQPIAIPLDPAQDIINNAQQYYKRYRKAQRALKALEPLMLQAQQEVHYLEQVRDQLAEGDLLVLAEIEQELQLAKYLSQVKSPPRPEISPYYQFLSPGGMTILCGRNNRQNEEITFKIAQPQDLWFHAQEIPGAHVLLQVPAGQSPAPEDLTCAANVAAHFSRARLSTQVPVLYTPRHRVRKLKGHLPGLVTYSQFQVLWGKPDQLPPAAITP